MISYIKGFLAGVEEDRIVVETGGIGYGIFVPLSVTERLPGVGKEVVIYTHFQVREDGMALYGFLSKPDRDTFRQLIGVNGVGPKAALGILSALTPDNLRMAIVTGDVKAISRAPGIGPKTAQRIILDLKDKISPDQALVDLAAPMDGFLQENVPLSGVSEAVREAAAALVALGYTGAEANRAIKQVEVTQDSTAEDILKASLRFLF